MTKSETQKILDCWETRGSRGAGGMGGWGSWGLAKNAVKMQVLKIILRFGQFISNVTPSQFLVFLLSVNGFVLEFTYPTCFIVDQLVS